MNLVIFLKKFFTSGLQFNDEKTREQVFFFNFLFGLFCLILVVFGVRQFLKEDFNSLLFFAVILVLTVFTRLIYSPIKQYSKSTFALLTLIIVSSVYSFWFAGRIPYAWMLIPFFPFFSIKILGLKKGRIHSTVLAILLLSGLLIPLRFTEIHTGLLFNLLFFGLYFLVLLIMAILDDSKAREVKELIDKSLNSDLALKQKNDFISDLSHQLRTSLSNIILVNNLIYNSSLDSNQKELIDTLRASTNNLLEAVNKIVDFSQPELFKIKESFISFNMLPALNSIANIFSDKTEAKITLDISPNIQNFLIGDPIKLKQIFLNLLQSILNRI